jgi:glycosyltransferase involved in cell wall biosynthesis
MRLDKGACFNLKKLRIAFLTPEFVTESDNNGGIATYVYRISKALNDMGHKPEVFTLSKMEPSSFDYDGIRVERVRPYQPYYLKFIYRQFKKLFGLRVDRLYRNICFAWAISRALDLRENEKLFDFVHSSDYCSPGLFVRRTNRRPLVVRSSWARDLCLKAEGLSDNFDEKCLSFLERKLLWQSNVVYAPSTFVANHYSKRYGLNIHIVRPPFLFEIPPKVDLPWKLPNRFLLHFATALGPVKGTDILATALPLVWREEPNFKMVWVGAERKPGLFAEFTQKWGVHAEKIILLGLLQRSKLFAVLKKAEATVLPSRYDNLPNTALESFAFGKPIIGPNGASFDELVEPGINGELFTPEDPVSLAKTMLSVWRRQVKWIGKPFQPPKIFNQMAPQVAALNLIRLAGF